ncbi:MAG: flagellar protein FlaG [Proteobacteria bacterium]|nr:flagellar protein FlaG [Pseudomonadota bacterium]
MSEVEISATGEYPSLISTDFATSYRTPNTATQPSAGAGAVVQPVNESAAVTTQPAKPPTQAEISDALAAANANLSSSDRTLEYRVDAATGISIATIRNSQTGVVVQQIPGANIIALARMLADWSPGKHMLLDLIA